MCVCMYIYLFNNPFRHSRTFQTKDLNERTEKCSEYCKLMVYSDNMQLKCRN